ncbi:hypothetical protein BCR35DRAFT_313286 [Leucosporidium creatinivorum]|uniref:Uncharacterized protein n=1 Tax=Leucosporidium creatinivorum TaxID=106004 RepID=A0A1Y2FRU7_9BASI|nr:hypothetical protein BCR35DRAFT_313286 [Leucosporidium creatinivorum]
MAGASLCPAIFLSVRLCGLVVRRRFPSTDKPEIAGSSPASVTFCLSDLPTACPCCTLQPSLGPAHLGGSSGAEHPPGAFFFAFPIPLRYKSRKNELTVTAQRPNSALQEMQHHTLHYLLCYRNGRRVLKPSHFSFACPCCTLQPSLGPAHLGGSSGAEHPPGAFFFAFPIPLRYKSRKNELTVTAQRPNSALQEMQHHTVHYLLCYRNGRRVLKPSHFSFACPCCTLQPSLGPAHLGGSSGAEHPPGAFFFPFPIPLRYKSRKNELTVTAQWPNSALQEMQHHTEHYLFCYRNGRHILKPSL